MDIGYIIGVLLALCLGSMLTWLWCERKVDNAFAIVDAAVRQADFYAKQLTIQLELNTNQRQLIEDTRIELAKREAQDQADADFERFMQPLFDMSLMDQA